MDNPNWFKPESPPGPLHTWRLHSCCPTVDKWALQKQSATGANPMVFHALLNSGNPQKVHCCNTVEIQNKCKREWLRLKAWDLAHLRCFQQAGWKTSHKDTSDWLDRVMKGTMPKKNPWQFPKDSVKSSCTYESDFMAGSGPPLLPLPGIVKVDLEFNVARKYGLQCRTLECWYGDAERNRAISISIQKRTETMWQQLPWTAVFEDLQLLLRAADAPGLTP